MCELGRERGDRPERTVDEHGPAGHRTVGEHGPVGGDPGYPQARAELVVDLVGQHHRGDLRDDGELRSGAVRAVGLGVVDPDPLPAAVLRDTLTDSIDDTAAVTVRDHPANGIADPK